MLKLKKNSLSPNKGNTMPIATTPICYRKRNLTEKLIQEYFENFVNCPKRFMLEN